MDVIEGEFREVEAYLPPDELESHLRQAHIQAAGLAGTPFAHVVFTERDRKAIADLAQQAPAEAVITLYRMMVAGEWYTLTGTVVDDGVILLDEDPRIFTVEKAVEKYGSSPATLAHNWNRIVAAAGKTWRL